MIDVLYCLEYRFMQKTLAAIERHVEADAAVLPLRPDASGCWPALPEIPPDDWSAGALDDAVRDADPSVLVANSLLRDGAMDVAGEYPLVHVRHGSSVGRGERETTGRLAEVVDVALAPGERWAQRYRELFPADVRTPVVGIPEADVLVGAEPPRKRRALYAPTNHNYGGGSYLETAEDVLDTFANSTSDFGTGRSETGPSGTGGSRTGSSGRAESGARSAGTAESGIAGRPTWELRFRPHPHDRTEEPGKSMTERCEDRIADLPNVTLDDAASPTESMLWADLLVSDYSGIVTEWLHTDRPLVQLTDVAADADVPQLGHTTDRPSLGLLERLYADGYADEVERAVEEHRSELGIPMDGCAGERAAREVIACTP